MTPVRVPLSDRVTVPELSLAVAAAGGAVAMVGIYLDTAWHRTIGRDSFFIPPHALVYGGGVDIAVATFAALAWATLRGTRDFGGPVFTLGRLRLPFGFTLTAAGILILLAAGPVDAFWHWMWGKDVLIWSPPHLQMAVGGDVTALGILFAVAAQRGRGWFRRAALWRVAMLIVLVDLIHRSHYVLAHYTMIPQTRTPDLYPFLASMLFPVLLVAAERAVGVGAATLSALLFVPVSIAMDVMLRVIEFDRYTVSPLVAVPAVAVTLVMMSRPRARRPLVMGALAGVAFALVFTAFEAGWMALVVERPWPWDRVVAGMPRSLIAGALSGWVGAILGGFLRGVGDENGARAQFGTPERARRLAFAALAVTLGGLVSTYQPQRYGPPMTVEELRLVSVEALRAQEAVFWEALLQDDWETAPRLDVRSEGVIDGLQLPVGPAWCAGSARALASEAPRIRFGLEVNGVPVDLSAYPLVHLRDHHRAYCAWVGIASTFQRASQNRFVYTIDASAVGARDGRAPLKIVDVTVVFKDP